MKRRLVIVLLTLLVAGEALADDVSVKIISVFPVEKAMTNINTSVTSVIRIESQKDGVVCYALAPNPSTSVRTGYPGVSISCVKK